jgi:hypothetical protein
MWITGNHDPVLRDRCGGAVMDEAVVEWLVLRHEADPAGDAARTVGSFPSQAAPARPRQDSRAPLFRGHRAQAGPARPRGADRGLDVDHPALVQAVGRPAEALVPVRDRTLRFPVAA